MEAEAAPVCAPVSADTQRQSATHDDRESGAEWHLTTLPDTPRHAGLGLQNRRVQVRFRSHLPLNPQFSEPQEAIWRSSLRR
jgi:hypothetical protein